MSGLGLDSTNARVGAVAVLGIVVVVGFKALKLFGKSEAGQDHNEQHQNLMDGINDARGATPEYTHIRAVAAMAKIAGALRTYAEGNGGVFPDDLTAVGLHGLTDPFSGQPYWYVPSTNRTGFTLMCMGSDQALGGTGPAADIKYTERGKE